MWLWHHAFDDAGEGTDDVDEQIFTQQWWSGVDKNDRTLNILMTMTMNDNDELIPVMMRMRILSDILWHMDGVTKIGFPSKQK